MTQSWTQRREVRVGTLVLGVFLLFTACFWSEITSVAAFIYLRFQNPPPEIDDTITRSFAILIYQCGLFNLLFLVSLRLLSRFVLSTQTAEQRRQAFAHLLLYIRGRHGPAVSTKDGVVIASQTERLRGGNGVAVVDASSAIVLERSLAPTAHSDLGAAKARRKSSYGELRQVEVELWRSWQFGASVAAAVVNTWRWLWVSWRRYTRHRKALKKPPQAVRIEGPGLVFVQRDESLRATLDLRRLSRSRPNIKALTREGIEVESTITVTFMLDEQGPLSVGARSQRDAFTRERNAPAFPFHPLSAFQAIYGSPMDAREDVKRWSDLPVFVASDIFRDLISTQTLDNVFRPSVDQEFPLTALRADFNQRVQSAEVLRQRGIRVIAAGFSRLTLPPLVKEQRFNTWRADWERQKTETLAGGDLQVQRVIQRARINAQAELVQQLNQITQAPGVKTAIILRLFQALEAASANPATRRLLPAQTIEILANWVGDLYVWLGPAEDSSSASSTPNDRPSG